MGSLHNRRLGLRLANRGSITQVFRFQYPAFASAVKEHKYAPTFLTSGFEIHQKST